MLFIGNNQKVIDGCYNGITTVEIDQLSAQTAASMISIHPDYNIMAARIEVSKLHKETDEKFDKVIQVLYEHINIECNEPAPLIDDKVYEIVSKNKNTLNEAIKNDRDYSYDYFGIKTLMKSYLLKINDRIVERPQHLLMRVSLGIHHTNIDAVLETYDLLSQKYFIHATPTLFNAGTPRPQLSSCFLLQVKNDSIEGIYNTIKVCVY